MSGNQQPPMGLEARRAAVEILDGVLGRRLQLEAAAAASKTLPKTSGADRAFAMHMVRTALRRMGQIDDLIDGYLQKPLPRKALVVRHVLRIGLAQLLFSDTPPHAAVSTTVELCRGVGMEGFAKLTNAVMRRAQREGGALLSNQSAAQVNTPAWLWDAWCAAYGADAATAIATQHLVAAPHDLSVKSDPEGWSRTLGGTLLMGTTVRLPNHDDVTHLPGFADGAWWVQDAAARLPVALLGDLQGKRVIDLCAAPGGKTLSLCAAGAEVTAVDISEKRLRRLHENLGRTGLSADVICADVREWTPEDPADIVLLDAPCTATGTIRRHPDLPYLKSAKDVETLTAVQDTLLDRAAGMTKAGGRLLYVTCSLQSEEGPERIEAFLARQPMFSRASPSTAALPGLPDALTPAGELRTLPHYLGDLGGMDGFYAAVLHKTNA